MEQQQQQQNQQESARPVPEIHTTHYHVRVGEQSINLPIVSVGDKNLAISLLMTIDVPISFIENAAQELAEKLSDAAASQNNVRIEVVATAAILGIPVGWAVAKALGLDTVVVLQKTPKIHLQDALVEPVSSVTTEAAQVLRLDRARLPDLAQRSTIFVDDVISSGSSTVAALRLLRRAGAHIVGVGVLLTEGDGWRQRLGDDDAARVTTLGKIPLFRPVEGGGWREDWSC
jgi:adenine/guanine phosphoribosyltransferase-like PRPP-binding protein